MNNNNINDENNFDNLGDLLVTKYHQFRLFYAIPPPRYISMVSNNDILQIKLYIANEFGLWKKNLFYDILLNDNNNEINEKFQLLLKNNMTNNDSNDILDDLVEIPLKCDCLYLNNNKNIKINWNHNKIYNFLTYKGKLNCEILIEKNNEINNILSPCVCLLSIYIDFDYLNEILYEKYENNYSGKDILSIYSLPIIISFNNNEEKKEEIDIYNDTIPNDVFNQLDENIIILLEKIKLSNIEFFRKISLLNDINKFIANRLNNNDINNDINNDMNNNILNDTSYILIGEGPGTYGIGAKLWDSALIMTYYLIHNQQLIHNKKVLELGSGTGFLGLATSLIGCEYITLTDMDEICPLLEANVQINLLLQGNNIKSSINVIPFEWSNNIEHLNTPYDVIILSDVVYDPEIYEPLITALKTLSDYHYNEYNINLIILMGYRHRNPSDYLFFNEIQNYFTKNILFQFDDIQILQFNKI